LEKGNRVLERGDRVSKRRNRVSERGSRVSKKESRVLERGNRVSERGSWVLERGNRVSKKGDRVLERGNRVSEREGRNLERGNRVSKRGNLMGKIENSMNADTVYPAGLAPSWNLRISLASASICHWFSSIKSCTCWTARLSVRLRRPFLASLG
jgi:hypothetical protein